MEVETVLVEEETVDSVEEIQLEEVPVVDTDEIANKVLESIQSVETEISVLDQFILDNGNEILNAVGLMEWWGFIGFPLVCIITFFYLIFKEFMYTRI